MKRLETRSIALTGAFVFSIWAQAGLAATISFTGDLRADATFVSCGVGCTLDAGNSDGDYAQYAAVVRSFNVPVASAVQAVSFSYGGGVNGAGTNILEGGLEPYLSLFDASGNFLASTFFGVTCPPGAIVNTVTGNCFDVLLDVVNLEPGNYQIALSAYLNMSLAENLGSGTLADGFSGLGNLPAGLDLHYAFDVILDSPAAIPEPESYALTIAALLGIYLLRKSRKTECGARRS
jgi:hypothetical protein